MQFEWDENKRGTNIIKHGFDFSRASDIFLHPIISQKIVRNNGAS